MERQSLQPLHLKNRWGLTALSVVLCLLASPLVSLGMFMPQFLAFLPVLALLLLGYVGPVSVVACGAVLVGLCGTLYGLLGGLCMALLLLPILAAAVITLKRGMGLFISAGICSGVLFASFGTILAVISLAAHSDVVTALTSLIGDVFESMGEMSDPLLLMFAQMGIIAPPDGMGLEQIAEGVRLTAQARGEMVAALVYLLDTGFRLELPAQITVGALGAGVLGQAVFRRGMLARGIEVPYTPLRKWRLPSGWGRVLGGTLAVLYVAAQLLPERLGVMAYVFYGVFTELFVLQGIAALCYVLHGHGKGRGWEAAVFAAGYLFLRPAATIVGIADQALDVTHRRKDLDTQENPYDPRARM